MSDKKDSSLIQAVKFTLFSASAGLIQFLSFTALTELPKRLLGPEHELPYMFCYLPALILSVLWNFTFNRKFTFKSANNIPIAMLKVAVYYLIFTPLSTYLGQLAANAGANHYLIEILTMLANFVTEFLYDKYIVFREKENGKASE